jgi:hypothetical protein
MNTKYKIFSNCYIDINVLPSVLSKCESFDRVEDEYSVSVYRSLDREIGVSVEHIVKIGNFIIKDVSKKTAIEFLEDVRENIEKIVQNETD